MGGGGACSITLVRRYLQPVHKKNCFLAVSLECIDVLDSYFIHRYIIIQYRSSSIMDKIHLLLSELWPLISVKNGLRAISFENIDVLDSYFIHRYIIIKYRSRSIKDKTHGFLLELWPFILVRKMVSG